MQTETERRLTTWFDDHVEEMHAMTRQLVNIDSSSHNKEGVDAVATVLQDWFTGRGIQCERIALDQHGDALRVFVDSPIDAPEILLMGHRDTVFPPGEPERRPYTTKDGRAYGPGVADMKSGIVQNAFIIAAFAELGCAPAPLAFLCTGDEEIGTPSSKEIILAEANKAQAVFNAEPGRVNGNIVTGRRGGVFFHCDVVGKAAHAGLNFHKGHSAIAEIASKINRWTALNEDFADRDITVNVGLVSGGQSVNTVAPYASCGIDMRYGDPAERTDLIAAIQAIVDDCQVPGTSATLSITGEFVPMKATADSEALFAHYQQAAKDVGFEAGGEFTRSSADSGLAASVGIPVLCAVGPVGGGAHSPDEFLDLSTVAPRAQAVALAILRLQADRQSAS